jgi:acetyltransferase-like isoleucine patch superfamily enzyme
MGVDAKIGDGTNIWHPDLVNIYGCFIGKNCSIAAFVEIGPRVVIGDECRIHAFCFIPEGVVIGNNVFVGPRVTFLNDKYPPSYGKWRSVQTVVEDEVSIGGGAVILPGIVLGRRCLIGAGSVVTKDVLPGMQVVGVPAKICGERR